MTAQGADAGRQPPRQEQGVLRQMIALRHEAARERGRPPQLPRPTPATPARVAATAFGRVAERLYGLAVRPISVKADAMTLAELTELLPERPLLVLLQGPGDSLGVMALCPEALAALVEIQALGRVTARQLERRPPTRSEALLCTDFINALMIALQSDMGLLEGYDGFARFQVASSLEDPRPLSLLLEDRPFRSLDFRLSMGAPTAREGRILLALPQPAALRAGPAQPLLPLPASPDATPAPAARLTAPDIADAAPPLPEQVLPDVEIELVAVLCRRQISLGELRGLSAGKLLHLPRMRLSDAVVETAQGQLIARGKFGEAEGCHAIRLRDPDLASEGETPPLAAVGAAAASRPGFPDDAAPAFLPPVDLSESDIFRSDEAPLSLPDLGLIGDLDRDAG